jgi:hypothetical protein
MVVSEELLTYHASEKAPEACSRMRRQRTVSTQKLSNVVAAHTDLQALSSAFLLQSCCGSGSCGELLLCSLCADDAAFGGFCTVQYHSRNRKDDFEV